MIKYLVVTLTFLFISAQVLAESRVRRVPTKADQIVTVRTAIGIATIIQVPDRPNSVVVGDQDGFKVEYLDQAITIKPLHGGAKSNLYIYTDWRRFNVQLVTGNSISADYVVYLENAKEQFKQTKKTLTWMPFKNKLVNNTMTLETKRLGRTRDGVLIVDFVIRDLKRQKIRADWLWLTQKGQTRPIHNLFLSGLESSPDEPIRGMIQILKTDINTKEPLRIEMRKKTTSYLTIPKVVSWK